MLMLHFFILHRGNKRSAVVAQPGSERAACRYSKLSALAQEMMCWYWDDEKPQPRQEPALIRNVFKVQPGTTAQRTRPRRARVDLIEEACITHSDIIAGSHHLRSPLECELSLNLVTTCPNNPWAKNILKRRTRKPSHHPSIGLKKKKDAVFPLFSSSCAWARWDLGKIQANIDFASWKDAGSNSATPIVIL